MCKVATRLRVESLLVGNTDGEGDVRLGNN